MRINQVRFFDYIIIFMLAQIAELRLCALMSLRPYVIVLMSGFVKSERQITIKIFQA